MGVKYWIKVLSLPRVYIIKRSFTGLFDESRQPEEKRVADQLGEEQAKWELNDALKTIVNVKKLKAEQKRKLPST